MTDNFFLPNGRPIMLTDKIGSGDEGVVYRIEDTDDLCAKIYFDQQDTARRDRLIALLRAAPVQWHGDHAEHLHLAWPRELVVDDNDVAHGFLMPLVEGSSLTRLFDPMMRQSMVEEPSWRVVIVIAARIARLIGLLHNAGVVVGDLKPKNLLVSRSGHVTLIDCDSVQFVDSQTGRTYPCSRLTPEYCPPVPAGMPILDTGHDTFSLAIMVCELLMVGEHPFEGVPFDPNAPDATAADNIRMQNNRLIFPERFLPAQGMVSPDVLPPEVRHLARMCFGEGHLDQAARPPAQDWAKALDRAGFQLMGCRVNERHVYHWSLPECVWCGLRAGGVPDPFPPAVIPKVIIRQPAYPPVYAGVGSGQWTPPPPPVAHAPVSPAVAPPPQSPKPVIKADRNHKAKAIAIGIGVAIVLALIVLIVILSAIASA